MTQPKFNRICSITVSPYFPNEKGEAQKVKNLKIISIEDNGAEMVPGCVQFQHVSPSHCTPVSPHMSDTSQDFSPQTHIQNSEENESVPDLVPLASLLSHGQPCKGL